MNTPAGLTAVPSRRDQWLQYLSLFSSLSTLLCCALPSLLVLFGLGATVATVLSSAPWLVTLSQHKVLVFGIAGALIAGNFAYLYRFAPRSRAAVVACAGDEGSCATAARFSKAVLWLSGFIYLIGFLTAFALGPFFLWWDAHH